MFIVCVSVGHCLCLFLNLMSHLHTEQHQNNRKKNQNGITRNVDVGIFHHRILGCEQQGFKPPLQTFLCLVCQAVEQHHQLRHRE